LKFTPGQVRTILGMKPETYRHWRRALPALRPQRGQSPSFTVGDLAALAVTKTLVDTCGLRVSALAEVSVRLFETCNRIGWTVLERSSLVIDVVGATVSVTGDSSPAGAANPLLVVPCAPLLAQLRNNLLHGEATEVQQYLSFPPTAIGSRA
jgi:hypothetical protein